MVKVLFASFGVRSSATVQGDPPGRSCNLCTVGYLLPPKQDADNYLDEGCGTLAMQHQHSTHMLRQGNDFEWMYTSRKTADTSVYNSMSSYYSITALPPHSPTHLCIDKVSKVLQPLLVRSCFKCRPNFSYEDGELVAAAAAWSTVALSLQVAK